MVGDFNLPTIARIDGYGKINSTPTYGTKVTDLFLDVINDTGFEQFVDLPTHRNNLSDLVFSTYSNVLDLIIIPGMSDHKAITFYINILNKFTKTNFGCKVTLYHKANIDHIKSDLLEFQNTFLVSDPYSKSIEQNWSELKQAIFTSISKMYHTKFCTLAIAYHGLTDKLRRIQKFENNYVIVLNEVTQMLTGMPIRV